MQDATRAFRPGLSAVASPLPIERSQHQARAARKEGVAYGPEPPSDGRAATQHAAALVLGPVRSGSAMALRGTHWAVPGARAPTPEQLVTGGGADRRHDWKERLVVRLRGCCCG